MYGSKQNPLSVLSIATYINYTVLYCAIMYLQHMYGAMQYIYTVLYIIICTVLG